MSEALDGIPKIINLQKNSQRDVNVFKEISEDGEEVAVMWNRR